MLHCFDSSIFDITAVILVYSWYTAISNIPVAHDWLGAVTKEKSHTAAFISDDKIESAKSSGISYEALREVSC